MPLVHIHLKDDVTPERRRGIADAVHGALVAAFGVPPDDRFQIVTRHADDLIHDPGYLGIQRSDAIVIVQVLLSTGRGTARKKALFQAIADRLHAEQGVRREDVMITLTETAPENWSFGNGIAQYADTAPPHLAA